MDKKELGNAYNASDYSIKLVKAYLESYKFSNWHTHQSSGKDVTQEDRAKRAEEIAKQLCDNSFWKTHSAGINRDVAWAQCKIKIEHIEDIDIHLQEAVRKFWAMTYLFFENSPIYKTFFFKRLFSF